jgi:hypothetical protein
VLFNVKKTPKGVFIDISPLLSKSAEIGEIKTPQQFLSTSTAGNAGNDSLPACSSSSFLDLKRSTTTTRIRISNDSLLHLSGMGQEGIHILADVITFYGYSSKDISPKLLDVLLRFHKEHGLDRVAYNLAYAAKNKRVNSTVGYLLKTLTDDYGSASLPYDDMEKALSVIGAFKSVRSSQLDELGASDLRNLLFMLDRPVGAGYPRGECERVIYEIFSRSDDLFDKLNSISKEFQPNRRYSY